MCCIIKDLGTILDDINKKRALKGEKVILAKDWSTFISGLSENKVRQHWINEIKRGQCVKKENALILMAAINAVLKSANLPLLTEDALECSND